MIALILPPDEDEEALAVDKNWRIMFGLPALMYLAMIIGLLVFVQYDSPKFYIAASEDLLLADGTTVGNVTWQQLKIQAMGDNYQARPWFAGLTSDDKQLLGMLRTAQKNQGDLKPLEVEPDERAIRSIHKIYKTEGNAEAAKKIYHHIETMNTGDSSDVTLK